MHNGLTYLSSRPSLLSLNLSDTTIWSTFADNKSIASLDLWNSFLLSIILLSCSVF